MLSAGGNPKQRAATFNGTARGGGISFYILSQGAELYNLITAPFMPEHFRTFPIRAAARRHSAAHTSLSWCHSLLSDGLEMKGGGRGGQAGMTIQESSWLMGISRCPERGGSGRESGGEKIKHLLPAPLRNGGCLRAESDTAISASKRERPFVLQTSHPPHWNNPTGFSEEEEEEEEDRMLWYMHSGMLINSILWFPSNDSDS